MGKQNDVFLFFSLFFFNDIPIFGRVKINNENPDAF